MKWTKEQEQAIVLRDSGLLVAAGAGSGKTAVLVERIARMVTEYRVSDIDRILIVTFTNAAASEMKERILTRIRSLLKESPEDANLMKQMALLSDASIMTIDSFCRKVVDENIHASGINPGYSVISGNELELLRMEAMEEVLEEEFSRKDLMFLRLADMLIDDENSLTLLGDRIMKMAEFSESFPDPDHWLLHKAVEGYEDVDGLMEELKAVLGEIFTESFSFYDLALRKCEGIFPATEKFLKEERQEIQDLSRAISRASDYTTIRDLVEDFGFRTLVREKAPEEYKELKEEIKNLRDGAKKLLNEYFAFVEPEYDDMVKHAREIAEPLLYLGRTAVRFRKNLKERMEARNGVSFSDISHAALRILTDGEGEPTETALRYRDFYDEIMIDEYQDSNDVQENILSAVSRDGRNVFMVGDVKQSIYRFRQANPTLFLRKYAEFSEAGEVEDVDPSTLPGRKIMLFKNFRSRQNVLSSVNLIFRALMSEKLGDIDYTEREELVFGSEAFNQDGMETKDEPIEIDIIGTGSEESAEGQVSGTEEDENPTSMELEAAFVAERIRRLMEEEKFQVVDRNGRRNLEYRDIVILMRSVSGAAPVFRKVLSENGIPVYSDDKAGYFTSMEIETMISLLKIIDNPFDDIPLLAVMRSPFFGFTEEEFIEIRKDDRRRNIYDCLLAFRDIHSKDYVAGMPVEPGNRALAEKIASFIDTLDIWRRKALYMPLDEFIWMLYQDTGFYDYADGMVNGKQRTANLRMLYHRAGDYERSTFKGIYNFIRYLDRIRKSEGDMGEAKILSENENLVRIMSIHKSKGLEFPVVFLSGLGRRFNRRDSNGSFIIHGEKGVGIRHLDTETNVSTDTLRKKLIRERISRDSASEEMRILYVALTRAKERLILTGTYAKLENARKKWRNSADFMGSGVKSPVESLKDMTMGDWILPIFMAQEGEETMDGITKEGVFSLNFIERGVVTESTEDVRTRSVDDFGVGAVLTDRNILERLKWNYRFREDMELPGKVSVSVLKKRAQKENEDIQRSLEMFSYEERSAIKKPEFMKTMRRLTGADRGTAFHTVMMHISPGVSEIEEVRTQIDALVEKEILLKEEAETVDPKKILAFLSSDVGLRFRDADLNGRLYKEEMFYQAVPAKEILEGTGSNEKITVIGIIDAFFEELDGLVLIDYKTDRIPENAGPAYDGLSDEKKTQKFLLDRYGKQMELYSRALTEITGKRVKEIYLYSVSTEGIVPVEIDG